MNYQTQIDVGLDFGNIRLAIGAYEVIIPSEVARKLAQDVRDILAAVKDPAAGRVVVEGAAFASDGQCREWIKKNCLES